MQSAEAKRKRQQLLNAFAALGAGRELSSSSFFSITLYYCCMEVCMLK
jgi:hypothetical protein